MLLREGIPFVGSLCVIVFVFGTVTCSDVIGQSTNDTSTNSTSIGARERVEDALLESSINLKSVKCLSNDECLNGGSCVDQGNGINTCQCRNGTSGDRCQIVDECVKCGKDPGAKCVYNVEEEKAECKCLDDNKAFDSFKKMCRIPCKTSKDCEPYIRCRKNTDNSLMFCRCSFGLGGDKCHEEIDECKAAGLDCGSNPNVTCEQNSTGHAVCHCSSWSDGYNYEAKDCLKCECGGNNLGCLFFPGGEKKCYCNRKFYQKDGKCKDCDCGSMFEGCTYENGMKRCKCYSPYIDNKGTCELCDCGKNSNGCTFEKGVKKCSCKDTYIVSNGICKKNCSANASAACQNGGKCGAGNVCKCLPGTKGDQCEIIEGCEDSYEVGSKCGYRSDVSCKFNVTSRKPYCQCIDRYQIFDSYDRKCKGCSCGRNGKCNFVFGKKNCDCDEGYAERPSSPYWGSGESQCESCECGVNSVGCKFASYYDKECICKSGYSERNNICYECDCGPNGYCSVDSAGKKACKCYNGYADKNGYCVKCDCGLHGECFWNEFGVQGCNCQRGYGVKYGKCTECNCYMYGVDYVNCTFPYGYQECKCPQGYEESASGYCSDIDECKDITSCPRNTDCINREGSYECVCRDGYMPLDESYDPKDYGCTDIDECTMQNECPYRDTTRCINTLGSYYCECKDGYYNKFSRYTIEHEGCQVDQTGWQVGYSILIVVFGIISLVLIIAILKKK